MASRRWSIPCTIGLIALISGPGRAQSSASSVGDVLRVMLIPSLEYTNLQGIRKLAASEIALLDVHDNLAGQGLPASMQKQMWQSYQDELAKQRTAIDSLRTNLQATQWCRYGTCHPAPNNQLVRDVLAAHHVAIGDVVALDASHAGGVVIYYESHRGT